MATKRASKAAAEPASIVEPMPVTSYKGFGMDWTCRGFQFEVGKTYEHDGKVEACSSGFHACEHPLNVFAYYPPATSRYAVVTQSGEMARHGEDTKIASARITIEGEIKLPEMVAAAIKWVFDRAKWSEGPVATEANEGATASGDQGAATASGRWGAATASGRWGAATASGRWGAATASGYQGRAQAKDGAAIFLVERDGNYQILSVWAGIAGRDGIKPDTFYRLIAGKPVEVE